MSLEVLAPGPQTTVQDLGRCGWRHLGVARGGALDPEAAMLANRLVGNAPDAAVLELTLHGPTLRLHRPVRLAICGARVDATFEPDAHPPCVVPAGRPVALPPGTLRLKSLRAGARAWVAVAGGLDVPLVLGSRSTDLRGGFGGVEGRALRAGDVIGLVAPPALAVAASVIPRWRLEPRAYDSPGEPIRFVPSMHSAAGPLMRELWRVHPDSNRQGLRLDGRAIATSAENLLSAAVAPGTIQLPPDGQPIVLLADAQTVGGYPRLGHVIAVDLPRLARLRPGDALRFAACDLAYARQLSVRMRHRLARAMVALEARLCSA